MQHLRVLYLFSALIALVIAIASARDSQEIRAAPVASSRNYLPLISKAEIVTPTVTTRRVNAPYFNVADLDTKFSEAAIFWFGAVSQTSNWADVRVAYSDTELYLRLAAIDRRLWYDTTPALNDATAWDAVTVLIDRTGNSDTSPTPNAYRLIAQLGGDTGTGYRAAYRGDGSNWIFANTYFSATTAWRGNALNDDTANDRGWTATFRIPFASLGISAPAPGMLWGLGVILHDRDDLAGTPIADQVWPPTLAITSPATWGQVRFGLQTYTPPPANGGGIVTVRRQQQTDATVPDASVGSVTSNQCPGSELYIWDTFENLNYGSDPDFNIQNQADVADWPCFARYYVSFDLNAIPPGKKIITATLTLHHFGNSGAIGLAQPSLIQVMSVNENWNENTITWNNAPLAWENVSRAWVEPVLSCNWPCVPRVWDVSRAVADMYAAGRPMRFALYSADSAYHSGKFFVTSDTGDWNLEGRPRLDVRWSEP